MGEAPHPPAARGHASWLARVSPFVASLHGYDRARLKKDLVGALTVTALHIPEGMAYAQLAGLPPQAALYSTPAALALYALFGSSRQLIVAVSASVSVLSAATVGALAQQGSPRFVALTAALALLAGAVAALAGVLKLGRVAQFFSASVLSGFVFGLALIIAIKQVPKLLGIEGAKGGFFERLGFILSHLGQTHPLTLVVGASSIAALLLLGRVSRRIPAALAVLVLGIAVSALLHLDAKGVAIVGPIPSGLVSPRLPPGVGWQDLLKLLPGACGIALVAFAEAIGPARMFAAKHGYEVDPNRELVGLGAANVGGGLFRGFGMGCSLSKSAANDQAGSTTQVSSLVTAGLTLLVALFLTGLFRALPEATLGAIVVVAILGMMDVKELARLAHLRRADFLGAAVALLGVLAFDVLPGLLIAVGVSLFLTVYRASRPRLSELGRVPGTLDLAATHRESSAITLPGLHVFRPEEGLFFANATSLRDEVLVRVRDAASPVREVLLDLELTDDLDVPGADMLAGLHEDLSHRGITLALARVHAPTHRMLERTGVLEKVGAQNVYPQVSTGVEAWMARHESQVWQEWRLIHDGLDLVRARVDEAGATLHGEERHRQKDLLVQLDEAESRMRRLLDHLPHPPSDDDGGPRGPTH
ncbi:SulP family inorganic anion transporter [Corallococcus silvisoli]|uniref:SulP family inorganic anion transporter n=1 Tax=Corallococcus silvisoli TaxID=2697031 RepID=UPI001377773F|nr:sulfate permease [Corallococcus silvisoli]NBD11393.1 sulfate permease [Corallococcus silvisoli]